jgi:hypothetical protein
MNDLPLFAYVPYVRHSETSRAAADAMAPHVTPLQQKVMDFLREHGPATDEEMQAGIPMGANTQRPRRVELVAKGRVIDSGKTRTGTSGKQAVVWAVSR